VVFNCSFAPPPGGDTSRAWLRDEVGPKLLEMVRQLRERGA
jgi:hypothetical protein